jgi:enoyl-CoA hydratase
MAKLSVNEVLDRQGQSQAIEAAFKNYMLTIPHRKELGTFGGGAAPMTARERIVKNNTPRD